MIHLIMPIITFLLIVICLSIVICLLIKYFVSYKKNDEPGYRINRVPYKDDKIGHEVEDRLYKQDK